MGIKSTKYKRSTPVPHTIRCKHVRKFAELYSDDLSLQNLEEYVNEHITPKHTVLPSKFKSNISKLYNWLTRDNITEFHDAIEVMFNDRKEVMMDLTTNHIETEKVVPYASNLSDHLDKLHLQLMGIPRGIRISFLEKFLQTQKISA